jgi:hypothetical protein
LTAPASGSDPIAAAASASRSNPVSGTRSLGGDAALPVTDLCGAAQLVCAIIVRVRRHYPSMRALRVLLCQHRQDLGGERFILFVLRHRQTWKVGYGTEYRNSDENLDHEPTSEPARKLYSLHSEI